MSQEGGDHGTLSLLFDQKLITSLLFKEHAPAQVGCMRQALGPGALGKPRGSRSEREVGGGIGMGNTCKPMAVSFQCMTKFTTNKKKEKKK